MAINTYETLSILDSNHYARDPGGVSKQVNDIITAAGGNVLVSRLWMEAKLAYPIDKHQKGTYWLTYFEIDANNLTQIARAFQLAEPVVRELTLKLDPRLVEPILANARGEAAPTEEAGSDESAGKAAEPETAAAKA